MTRLVLPLTIGVSLLRVAVEARLAAARALVFGELLFFGAVAPVFPVLLVVAIRFLLSSSALYGLVLCILDHESPAKLALHRHA